MIPGPLSLILAAWLMISAMMAGLWLLQRKTHNAGVVDAGWAAGVGMLGVLFAATSGGFLPRRVLVAIFIGFWALRLTFYLVLNRLRGRAEDGRYASLRKQWGPKAERKLFFFFQSQAFFALFFSLPILIVAHHPRPHWSPWDLFGGLIWFGAVGNTILADWQLAKFRATQMHKGKTCRIGWWRYSRHPNYFFEWLHWWSYVALAFGSPFWWVTLTAPAAMLYLLLRVTGIPPTEAQALASRGEDYRSYQRTTPMFFPWLPKKEREHHGSD